MYSWSDLKPHYCGHSYPQQMVQTSHRKRLRHLRVRQENILQISHVQVGTPAAASSRQPESSILPLGEYLPCSSLALFPFSGLYLCHVHQSVHWSLHFSGLPPKGCSVFLCSPPAPEAHSSAPYTAGHKPSSSPPSFLWPPHCRPTPFPTAGETVSAGSHGTPALWIKLILLHFKWD